MLKYDPRASGSFQVFGVPEVVDNLLHNTFPDIKEPTMDQKAMLSVLNSNLSIITRQGPGTGKSLAVMLHALSMPRNFVVKWDNVNMSHYRRQDISYLILAPNDNAVRYYEETLDRLISSSDTKAEVPKNMIFQALYGENTAENLPRGFKDFQHPHILVATPKTVLWLLHKNAELVNFRNLKCVAFENAEELFTSKTQLVQMGLKKRHEYAATALLKQIIYVQRQETMWVEQYKIHRPVWPLQFAFMCTPDGYDAVKKTIEEQAWCRERAVAPMGAALTQEGSDYVRTLFPKKVDVSIMKAVKTELGVSVCDINAPAFPTGYKLNKLVHDENFVSFDEQYIGHRRHVAKDSQRVKLPDYLLDCVKTVTDRVFEKSDELWNGGKTLIIVPECIPLPAFTEVLAGKGVEVTPLERFTPAVHAFFTPTNDSSRHLLAHMSQLKGVPLPNLSTIITVGVDAIADNRVLVELAGFTRNELGLHQQRVYKPVHKNKAYQSFDISEKQSRDGKMGRIIHIVPGVDLRDPEKLNMGRSLIKAGVGSLVRFGDEVLATEKDIIFGEEHFEEE
ncbi:hypothetical protein BABINDRAFT_8309 [Babjeviella inositovora NRRL Y-12698]|uniref:DEAD/DEAH-box helicase domain-containing protein n=1 Tax=Babjeviella inositovora NRRL Y-12698 TaxID=984486 RepID=A0A1E3QNW0_9ASCO|nr:uncharacterized protein BABINDRAFT_8309 [Babjeviella inositovora NRRL Y-12698]ODQ79365.1 hypothetical protein BABINDRAFT_8309 [Babjeviella inositovora NRRL Y-12698]